MILVLILFAVGLFIGIKIAKSFKKKPMKSVPVEEGGIPSQPVETQEVKEPIKAVKIAGIRIDIKELKEKSSHLCEGLKHIVEIER